MVTLCRAAIFPDWPVPIVPLGVFCHSRPVLDQILSSESYVSGSEVTSAIFRQARSLYSSAAYRHRDTFSREPCSLQSNGIHALAVPDADQKFRMECSSELEHCRNLCQSADSKVERM